MFWSNRTNINFVNATETENVSRQTGKLITLRLAVFDFYCVQFQLHKCFIDVFELNSPFIVTHNKCIINVTLNVMVALTRFADSF